MYNRQHVEIVRGGSSKINAWHQSHPCVRFRLLLSGADLSGAELTWADLRRANLSGANLSGAFIEAADLREANLSGANLSEADIHNTSLRGADLTRADLSRADLSGANFSGADLSRANLSGRDLRSAVLRGAILSKTELRGAILSGVDLTRTILKDADLREADLTAASLKDSNLEGANLGDALLTRADLTGANLRNVVLTGVAFADPDGIAARLDGAVLSGAVFTEIGQGDTHAGFLELACTEGLETAEFGDKNRLENYLSEAFEYVHRPGLKESHLWPKFVDQAVARIRALHSLLEETADPPAIAIKTIQAITAEIVAYLKKHPRELYNLKPRQFEELIGEILASYGWEVQLTAATRDGGYDMFAISRDVAAGVKTSWIIECKKYSAKNKVGIDLVRGLYCVRQDLQVANILLATTSYFSAEVHKYKASRYDLELRDFEGIVDWLNNYRPHPNGKLYIQDRRLVLPSDPPIATRRG